VANHSHAHMLCHPDITWYWQYKRLHWKSGLLVQIEQAAEAAPLTDLTQADILLAAGEPLDFRRIELNGAFIPPTLNGGQPCI